MNATISAVLHNRKSSSGRRKAVRRESQLHTAARVLRCNRPRKRVAILAALLDEGGDVHGRDEAGCTPLHLAADVLYEPKDEEEAVELLELGAQGVRLCLEAGAEIDPLDDQGRTPLLLAARSGQEVSARLLLEAGADPDKRGHGKEGEEQATPREAATAVVAGSTREAWWRHRAGCEAFLARCPPPPPC